MSAQPDLFAPKPTGNAAEVIARVVEILDRDAPWTREQAGNDVEYRVYYLLCSWLCHRDLGKHTARLTPVVMKIRDFLRTIDADEARAFVADLDVLFPGIKDDGGDE